MNESYISYIIYHIIYHIISYHIITLCLIKSESPLHLYALTVQGSNSYSFPYCGWSENARFYFRGMTDLKFSEVEFKLPWERNAPNIKDSREFLYGNKTVNFSTPKPNRISKHRILAINCGAVTSGWTPAKARGFTDTNMFSQRVFRKTVNVRIQSEV